MKGSDAGLGSCGEVHESLSSLYADIIEDYWGRDGEVHPAAGGLGQGSDATAPAKITARRGPGIFRPANILQATS